ncbi:single-stranded DNA-binding protein [Caulobacter sp.]|uniref:single-stranded DNA-binding protein n=1 Tax=Caulobacter sp. TaxID=78 RepID=UPI001B1C36BC|nr:single-stranded DNA-binding protein [Caulobacter sp.]MBO9546970.1 single-stranded DNA-binding protein [Caulobacter sp.]
MLNKVQLIGNTGADSEIRSTANGKKYATLRVATGRYAKKGDERCDYTTWHQIEIWSPGTVKWLEGRALPKGAKVYVEGEIRHEQYLDKDGQKRFFSKVVIAGPGHELKALERLSAPDSGTGEPEPGAFEPQEP